MITFKKSLSFFLFFIFVHSSFSQVWTEKNEDENYTARHEHGFVQIGDKFYIFGGRENPTGLEIYDYTSNSWSNGSNAPLDFNHFQAIAYEGLIWVIGAFQTNDSPEINATHIYMYNPTLDQWIQGISIPLARQRGSAGVALYNDKFYILGGNTNGHSGGYVSYFDEYDAITGAFISLTDAPRARDHFHAVVVNDKLYAIGGRLTGGSGGLFEPQVPEIDVFDFSMNSWSTLDPSKNLPHPRAGLTACVFQDEIYTIGGESTFGSPTNTNGPRDVVEAFNPITESWTTKASLNYSRHGIQAIVSGDGIFVTGGSSGVTIKNMEYYNTDNPQGTAITSSIFQADETLKIFEYEESDGSINIPIALSNTGGDTGTFIDSIEISGDNFTLNQTYTNRFLKSNSVLNIEAILNDTTQPTSNGLVTVTYNNSSQLTITLQGSQSTLSINDINGGTKIKLYPNPTYDTFSINNEIRSLTIFDVTGKVVKTFNDGYNKDYNFDISNLSPNLYFIRVTDNNGFSQIEKLIKL